MKYFFTFFFKFVRKAQFQNYFLEAVESLKKSRKKKLQLDVPRNLCWWRLLVFPNFPWKREEKFFKHLPESKTSSQFVFPFHQNWKLVPS